MASVAYTLHNVFPISPEAERERLSHRESTNGACQSETKGRREPFIDLDEQLETSKCMGEGHEFDGIIGSSKTLRAVLDQIRTVASAGSTVLIEGETGTGKELIARAVHMQSQRRDRPFVKLNCAAIPLELLESELFGHERGAFTGAVTQRDRPIRGGQRRHAFPGRNRRHPPGVAVEATASPARAGVRTPGQHATLVAWTSASSLPRIRTLPAWSMKSSSGWICITG